jgi:hypothetical protein
VDDLNEPRRDMKNTDLAHARQDFLDRRKDVEFLGLCVGSLILPTGVKVLTDMAVNEKGPDPKTTALLRRKAVWALANLGENVKRFARLPPADAERVLAELQTAAVGSAEQADGARAAYEFLSGARQNVGVIDALARTAKADEPFLRTLVAHALTFWPAEGPQKTLAEQTLLALSFDDGRGVRIEIGQTD